MCFIKNMVSASALFLLMLTAHADIVFDMRYIGNPGNTPDPTPYGPPYDPYYHGQVNYDYQIGTYEATVAQYTEFLNAKATSDPYGLYDDSMSTGGGAGSGYIFRSGASGSYTYSVASGKENQPVRHVTLYDSMRFCNWLHNGQEDGDTESGSYNMSLGLFADRQEGATWVIPSEDEWYKAAYYDSVNELYYDYPNGTDDIPDEPTDETSTRVFNFGDIPYWPGYFTSVGETTGRSPYGVYDMGGNVEEWTDTMDAPYYQYRVVRGGSLYDAEDELRSSSSIPYRPDTEGIFGFRIAYIIPEPASCLLMLLGGAVILGIKKTA